MKKKILITGSNGMLGMDLARIVSQRHSVICTDIKRSSNPLCKDKDFIKCDITDRKAASEAIKRSNADIVLHTAAWTDVDGCELDKDNAIKINSEGAHNIALGCKKTGALMCYISSDFIFDGEKNGPYSEDDRPNPLNTYGLSKLKGEEAVRKELDRYFIVRTSWLFGKNGKNFVDIILDKAERGKELKVVIDQFGSPTFTKDLSRALDNVVSAAIKNKNISGVFHFCNSGSCSWYKYAEEILKIIGKRETALLPITSVELKRPAVRPKMSILNTEKYTTAFGERPRDWESALRYYLIRDSKISGDYYVQNFK